MAKFGANLPSVLNPLGDICVQVTIPAHPDYIKLFLRAIRMLEVNRMYARDADLSAKVVVEQWRNRTITPLIEALANETSNCQDLDGECLSYPPFASFVSYFPQNPFTEPDLIPDGFEQPPFFVNGKDNAHDLPNYQRGDVLLDFGSINIEPSWDLDKTPRIELCLTGSGVVELHFLNIVQGGIAIVSVDNPVDLGDILAGIIAGGIDSIDLNQDIISLPPETVEEIVIEKEIATEGDHTVYIYFVPTVNDSLIPLSFGGGLREISLCGNIRPCGTPAPEPPPPLEGVTELKPEFRFTADCGLEYRLRDQEDNIVQDWQLVSGWVDNADACFRGADGVDGVDGVDGADGADGANGADGVNANVTPPIDSYETDELCNAAEYIKTKLTAFISDVIEDAATITLEEFLTTFLFGGGWDASLLKQLWDFAIANTNPDLLDEVTAAADAIVTALYCNNLDRAAFIAAIDADTSITDDAQAAIIAAFNTITDAQLSLWAFVGSQTATGSCSCANTKIWDFSTGQQGWVAQGADRATYGSGGWVLKDMGYAWTLVIEKAFTWPDDLIITAMRVYMDNASYAQFNAFYGMNYVNEARGTTVTSFGFQSLTPMEKGTKLGLGYEYSVPNVVDGQKITMIQVDYIGPESPDW
jgi:hypothetical protein